MKVLSIIILSTILLISCGNQQDIKNVEVINKTENRLNKDVSSQAIDTAFNFDNSIIGEAPKGWSMSFTGEAGEKPDWRIMDDNGYKVLSQQSYENPNNHFNNIVYDGLITKNVELQVSLKGVEGQMDQGGGFIWRFIDADNYYVVRANPLEDNMVLYKVENGKRTDLPVLGKGRTYGVDVKPLGSDWNILKLVAIDDLFTVYLNDEQIFQVKDDTFTNAGKVGLWTKADAVSYFYKFIVKAAN